MTLNQQPTTDPAARLQAAATRIRQLAAPAAAEIRHAYVSDYPRVAHAQLAEPLGDYAALMHPGVGEALAQWLETAATNAAALTWPNDFIERALAVADAILAGTEQ